MPKARTGGEMGEEVFFYANQRGTAHWGEVLGPNDDGTARVRAICPKGFEGRVFDVPRSEIRDTVRASERPEN